MFHFNSLSFAVLLAVVAFSSAAPLINLNGALTAALNPVGAVVDAVQLASNVVSGVAATTANAAGNLASVATNTAAGLTQTVGDNVNLSAVGGLGGGIVGSIPLLG